MSTFSEYVQGRVALHVVFAAKFHLHTRINFGQMDRVSFVQDFGSFLEMWRQSFAVNAAVGEHRNTVSHFRRLVQVNVNTNLPRRIELDQRDLVSLDPLGEIAFG